MFSFISQGQLGKLGNLNKLGHLPVRQIFRKTPSECQLKGAITLKPPVIFHITQV